MHHVFRAMVVIRKLPWPLAPSCPAALLYVRCMWDSCACMRGVPLLHHDERKDPSARIDFQFDEAGFDFKALPFTIPYPVPFRWLGDEVRHLCLSIHPSSWHRKFFRLR